MPRRRAKPRPLATRAAVRTSRVRLREAEFAAAHGPCEKCGKAKKLEAFWRSKDDRPLGYIQAYWLSGSEVRTRLADKLIVLCAEHMRVHKGGLEHGGGAAGIKGCDCKQCKARRRDYVKSKHREHRADKRGAT